MATMPQIGPQIGDPAPDFAAPVGDGAEIRLGDFKGRFIVLYFYPKDDTPGCTQEAVSFTQLADAFEAAGAIVMGVSKDSTASHRRFAAKHDLRVLLASDPDAQIAQAYGVWGERKLYGKSYMGVSRSTFLIDKAGTIIAVWLNVKVRGHAEEVLQKLEALSQGV